MKHYGCSLVLPKEVMGGKGGPSESQQVKAVGGESDEGDVKEGQEGPHTR